MIHRKVLDVAAADPEASLDDIAEQVGGASATFVKRVFEEYGDPARSGRSDRRTDGNGREPGSSRSVSTTETDAQSRDGASDDGSDEKSRSPGDEKSRSSTDEESRGADDETEGLGDERIDTLGDEETEDSIEASLSPGSTDPTDRAGERADGRAEGRVDDRADGRADDSQSPDQSSLSERQRETLRAVAAEPTATQAEIADRLGVSRATVSKRLNAIDGFEWAARREFVERLFDEEPERPTASNRSAQPTVEAERFERLERRLDTIEQRLESAAGGDTSASDTDGEPDRTDRNDDANRMDRDADPELTHKLVRACMGADYISRDEELAILRQVLSDSDFEPGRRQ